MSICSGPLETFVSHCGRFKSTINYILLPNCLHDSIASCKTFEQTIENTSDHLPLQLKINYYDNSCTALSFDNCSEMAAINDKVIWSNYSNETISTIYATSIANEMENMRPDDYNSLADSAVLRLLFVQRSYPEIFFKLWETISWIRGSKEEKHSMLYLICVNNLWSY